MSPIQARNRRKSVVVGVSNVGQERQRNKEALGINTERLKSFLTEHKCGISLGSIGVVALRSKEVESIARFLFQLIDPNMIESNDMKVEFPRIMDMLGYPQRFSRSSLVNPGTVYVYPTIIAAFTWLCDIIDVIESVGEKQRQIMKRENEVNLNIRQAYCFFVKCDNVGEDAIIQDISMIFDKGNQSLRTQFSQLKMKYDEINKELEVFKQGKVEIRKMDEEEKVLVDDIGKFAKLIQIYGDNVTEEKRKREHYEEEIQKKKDELDAVSKENGRLKETMRKQGIRDEEIEEIKKNYDLWNEKKQEIATKKETMMQQRDRINEMIGTKMKEIGNLVQTYQELMTALQLVPVSSAMSKGVNYALSPPTDEVCTSEACEKQYLNNPVFIQLESVLKEYMVSLEKAIKNYREEIVKYEDKKLSKQLALKEKQNSILEMKEKYSRLDELYNQFLIKCSTIKEATSKPIEEKKMELKVLRERMDLLRRENATLQTQMEREIAEQNRRMEILLEEEKDKQGIIVALLDSVSKYKEHVDNELDRMHSFCEQQSIV